MPQINRKIKKDIFDWITKNLLEPFNNNEKQVIAYGKICGRENNFTNVVQNDPEDFNIVLNKCGGCDWNNEFILERPKKSKASCVFTIMYDKFFKENANQYEADDKRIDEEKLLSFPISNEIISEFIKIEKCNNNI
ncbi:unnamed protein product [Rhizophagus irregularis]|nr:unnamed protein product [Rhizophagus irregularis]